MLIRSMFLVALLATISATILHASAQLAFAALHRRAAAAVRADRTRAIALAQSAIASAMQSGSPIVLPSPSDACVLQNGAQCAIRATSSLSVATPAPNAGQQCPAINCTIYLQGNDTVAEGRASVEIHTVAATASGAPLASGASIAVFRTLRVAPYALLSGTSSSDGLDELASGGTGDDGGAVNGASTLVNVEYKNGATTVPANVWGARVENPAQTIPAWDR